MSNVQFVIFIVVIIALVCASAFFSVTETALMAVNRYRLRHQARMKKRNAVRILQLLKRPDRLLGAVLIGNTFANVLASSLSTLIAYHFWGDDGALFAAIILTFVILIFAEIAPKTLAALYPERVARWVVLPIQIILKLLYPLVWLANTLTNGLLKLMRVHVTSQAAEPLSREELRSVVYDTTGKLPRQYQNMLLSVLDLNKLTVDDVLVPRHEIVGIDIEQPWDTLVTKLSTFHQDWVPIYRDNINDIMGVIYLHDVLRAALDQKAINKELLTQCMQPPYFVPQGTELNAQLAYFQRSHEKVAFVVDEYGEIQGLLTLNDILEEIVGDLTSHIMAGKRIIKEPDGSYLVDGTVTVREFNRSSDWELPLRGPKTINGLVIEHLQAMPHTGITVLIAGYPIEIIEVKENRVQQAKIYPQLHEPPLALL